MAPARCLPVLLALLTLAAAVAPNVAAQNNTSTGAIVLSTSAATYPPGGQVLFTLTNNGTYTVVPRDFQVFGQAGGVAKFALQERVPARGAFSFTWNATAPEGHYWGILTLHVEKLQCWSGGCFTQNVTEFHYVNGRAWGGSEAGWTLALPGAAPAPSPAPAPTGRLVVGTDASVYAPGQAVNLTLRNVGTADLVAATGCDVRFAVRLAGGGVVHESPTQVCLQAEQRLAPNASLALAWDQRTTVGPAKPGDYVVRAQFGARAEGVAEASFRIAEPGAPPSTAPPPAPPERRIALRAPAEPVPLGANVTLELVNTGAATLEGTPTLVIRDSANAVVHAPATAQVVVALEPGKRLPLAWDQRTDAGAQAPRGDYVAHVSFAGLGAMARFSLTGPPASAGTPPPAPPPEPSPPAPAAPPEEKPVVGRLGANASAQGCWQGDWVAFCVDAQARRVTGFKVGGHVVVEGLAIPGAAPITVEQRPGALLVRAGEVLITVYDSPAGALRAEARSGAAFALDLGPSVAASVGAGEASLKAPGVDALAVVKGGTFARADGRLTVDLGATDAAFVLRAAPPEPPAEPSRGEPPGPLGDVTVPARVALAAALPRAIAEEKVAAEAYLARNASGVATSVVAYVAADVNVTVADPRPEALTLTLDVSDHRGRTLVFHLGEGVVAGTEGGVRVLYDGAEIGAAAGLADVLDPDDDGLAAEYVLVQGSAGLQLVVSVPHFSVHTLSIQGLGSLAPSLAPYGGVAAAALLAVAAVVLLRRSRDAP